MPGSAPGTADVSFTPAGRRGTFAAGTTVLEAARALGVDLDSVCGARGICGRCQVEVGARPGVQADPARLSAPSTTELGYTGRRPFPDGRRLGCAAQILDDVVIDVPESSQVHRQVVRKDAGRLEVPVDPVLALHYVEVDEPTMVDAIGDLQRLRAALAKEWQLTGLEVDHSVLTDLQPALERGKRGVTVAVRVGSGRGGGLAGPARPGVRRGVRRRLHHARRPPVRPVLRRGARLGRPDEPADQLRRGPDEPGLLRDDESRW